MRASKKKMISSLLSAVLFLLVLSLVLGQIGQRSTGNVPETTAAPSEPTQVPTTVVTEPPHHWEPGYVSTMNLEAEYCDEGGRVQGTLIRGTPVEYEITPRGQLSLLLDGAIVYLGAEATIVTDPAEVVPSHHLFIRNTVNLRDAEGKLLEPLAQKGTGVTVTGYDYLLEDGRVHMYRVRPGDSEAEGYVLPWYLADTQEEALANYDDGSYAIHAGRGNRYGGGGAADLDYYPREKGPIEGNEMPEECRTLYLVNWRLEELDAYLEIANNSGINAFVVDIVDGGSIGYAADVMKAWCPTAAAAANNTLEDYQAAIRKLRKAGYYVIGRITTFNDSYFVQDHPEYAISNTEGVPLKLSGEYWPTPYSRSVWQYKVDLAVEAVELMGFNEIQFDYVRFPDNTYRYDKAGTIDYRNTYGETKAQAVQRFLMYAADILREHGAYVSADVYGESAYNYVTAYGQYWSAISNVVDVISGMPYPDHFGASGSWLPWEHPYDTLYSWGQNVAVRQTETATPAVVRTWIQAYNAIHEPYTVYGPNQVAAQIRALRATGCTGGYMTWNAGSSIDKYTWLIPAFEAPEGE
ncbi:MAG: hypothetical protein E7465_05805 [Ruminococcaceae bacterium]|nr:hypothetical protein [Oscillospiraceae bacterium]